ncbi:VapC toxin family PIN domain ribonuclease [Halobacteriales archaeon QS_8_69_26]|nr:MAG: VapC toxin family PIN domain ribonuclease [Halobacteriales archaeon QS_8_69_26]
MRCADTSFLVDYLTGDDRARVWLADNEDRPLHVPTVARFEIYRGALRADLPDGLSGAVEGLDWTEPLPFTDAAARESARIGHELREAGAQTNVADRLIAGTAREAGATLVTRDADVERVEGLDVVRYDDP